MTQHWLKNSTECTTIEVGYEMCSFRRESLPLLKKNCLFREVRVVQQPVNDGPPHAVAIIDDPTAHLQFSQPSVYGVAHHLICGKQEFQLSGLRPARLVRDTLRSPALRDQPWLDGRPTVSGLDIIAVNPVAARYRRVACPAFAYGAQSGRCTAVIDKG